MRGCHGSAIPVGQKWDDGALILVAWNGAINGGARRSDIYTCFAVAGERRQGIGLGRSRHRYDVVVGKTGGITRFFCIVVVSRMVAGGSDEKDVFVLSCNDDILQSFVFARFG